MFTSVVVFFTVFCCKYWVFLIFCISRRSTVAFFFFCLLLVRSNMLFVFHTSSWINKYPLLYHERPPKLPGCSWWERSRLYLRRDWSDLLALLWFGYYPLPDQYSANRKPQVQAGVRLWLFLVSRNWRGCCLSRTEELLLSSLVCSGRTKGETFKSRNGNQEPKSHWLLMKVRGRRFCCASETSSFSIVQVADGDEICLCHLLDCYRNKSYLELCLLRGPS